MLLLPRVCHKRVTVYKLEKKCLLDNHKSIANSAVVECIDTTPTPTMCVETNSSNIPFYDIVQRTVNFRGLPSLWAFVFSRLFSNLGRRVSRNGQEHSYVNQYNAECPTCTRKEIATLELFRLLPYYFLVVSRGRQQENGHGSCKN